MNRPLSVQFYDQDAQVLAKQLLGKVICRRYEEQWLKAMIIETEAYYLDEKGSHASLGYTEKRKALFMPAGTIYMYYARGGDSLNVSAQGEGNAVLIKGAVPYGDDEQMITTMQQLNPRGVKRVLREHDKLCSGQTLLCKSLALRVPEWDQQQFREDELYIADVSYQPAEIIQTTRLGIPLGRDEHLQYRFIDAAYAKSATKNPLVGITARVSYSQ